MVSVYIWPISFISGFVLLRWCRRFYKKSGLHSIAHQCAQRKRLTRDKRREELLNLLKEKYSSKLPDHEKTKRIYQSTATELLEGLRQKDFTYTQVVLVLSLRAIKIGQELNCTTEEFFNQAIEIAEKLDENNFEQEQDLLKGIPISLKDQINQKGADSSMGISTRNFRPACQDGLIVRLLKEQGAIAGFVRTATIQGMMLPDTQSDTYGRATNPYDQTRTTGGSSGGEGALIACRGSPIGIGTDIGGSIRIPAHFCGIFGFKPTPGRITKQGVAAPFLRDKGGETNIRSTVGPLARCTDDLVLVMRSLLQENMWLNDPQLCRQPWRHERFTDKQRLTIGFFTNDKWFSPAPACIRAVNEAADALRRIGHTVVPYEPIDVSEAVRLFISIVQADGSRHFFESLENEKINPLYAPLRQAASLPNFLRPFIASIMRIFGERRNAFIVENVGQKTAYEYYDLIIDLQQYINKWLDDMKENHIDLLLTPVNGLPAYSHGQSGNLFHSCTYTFLFNVLHLPAGVVPVTFVRDDEQYYEDIGNINRDRVVSLAKDVCRQSAGLPIGVQLVGWPNDEERVLSVMKELEITLGKTRSFIPNLANNIDIYND